MPQPQLIFSVDVEDWPQSSWDRSLPIGDYCADNARQLLELMSRFPASRGTFFILGKFAEKHPAVVREIQAAGHEVACHGHGHVEIFRLRRDDFKEDVRRAANLLGELTGAAPRGYRAPDFSIVGESLWALDVLAELGFSYDSSIFPLDRGRYGIGEWPVEPTKVRLRDGACIVEFPLTVTVLGGRRRPISGGGYARLLPGVLLRRWLSAEAARRTSPPVFYCHPYEIDPGEFRRTSVRIPLKVQLHQGLGRRGFPSKLQMLFREFRCISFGEAMQKSDSFPVMDYKAFELEPGSVTRPAIFA